MSDRISTREATPMRSSGSPAKISPMHDIEALISVRPEGASARAEMVNAGLGAVPESVGPPTAPPTARDEPIPTVAEIALSFWQRQSVDSVYRALLGRRADSGGISTYASLLGSPEDLSKIILSVLESDEFKLRMSAVHERPEVDVRHQCVTAQERSESIASNLTDSPAVDAPQTESTGISAAPDHPQSAPAHAQSLEASPHSLSELPEQVEPEQSPEEESVPAQTDLVLSDWKRKSVESVYRALLGRPADPSGLAMYVSRLECPEDISLILQGLLDSEEYKQRLRSKGMFRFRNEDMVSAVYAALLGRPADSTGLATYAAGLHGVAEVSRMIAALTKSAEYGHRMQSLMAGEKQSSRDSAIEDLDAVFMRLAGRPATMAELARCFAHGDATGRAIPDVIGPVALPKRRTKRRILLFGAFDNGNAGDAMQAMAMRQHVMCSWGLRSSQIFATSMLRSMDYTFPGAQKLPYSTLMVQQLLSQFDALIIGGGGLIAHPHAPLSDAGWVRTLRIPIAILGVGAVSSAIESHRALLNKAWFVSGRDAESVVALRQIREDACLLRDPIMCSAGFDVLQLTAGSKVDNVASCDVLWVLKHPANPQEAQCLNKLSRVIDRTAELTHSIVAIEPRLDRQLEAYFPERVRYTNDIREIGPMMLQARNIVTMRYHGGIFAAMCGRPAYGYGQKKIKSLFSEIGIAGAYELSPEQLARRLRSRAISSGRALVFARSDFDSAFKSLSARLFPGSPSRPPPRKRHSKRASR